MTEVHSMLNRMVELADQSANGTYDNPVDRANLQKEIASLKDEIDRIADSTNFNGINLLDGSLSTAKLDVKSATINNKTIAPTVNAATGTTSGITVTAGTDAKKQTLTVEYADESGTLLSDVEVTGNLLLDLMPVMFIPAAVGIIDKIEELKAVMIPMLIITFVTTFIVMSITGVTAEWIIKRQKKGEK